MFNDFERADFSSATRGTHWRHRRALGGELRKQLRRVYGRRYQTWGMPGANSIHVARRAAYQFPPHHPQAHLFVNAAPGTLRWGLQIPLEGDHWQHFLHRIQQETVALPILLYLLNAYDLTFTDRSDAAGGILRGSWRYEQGELIWWEARSLPRPALPTDIPFRLSELARAENHQLSLFTDASADAVVGWDAAASTHIMPALLGLIPLYELCVTPSL